MSEDSSDNDDISMATKKRVKKSLILSDESGDESNEDGQR